MSSPQLRLHSGDHTEAAYSLSCQAESVSVSIADIVPLLLDAALTNRVWLEDFADETLNISQDLYEVLLAYRHVAQTSRAAA
jgi:hypothetical protein